MDRVLVIVFDRETKAYEGNNALLLLEAEGSISIYASAIVAKNADGTVTVKKGADPGPVGTLVGTLIGALLGILGGPAGFAVGAATGLLAGGTTDVNRARISEDFIDDVTKALLPGKFAVVAEIQEDWATPVDIRMEAIGGTVFRRALSQVARQVHDEHFAAMKADLAQMKAEHAKAHANRKPKLKEKINQLDSKIQAQLLEAQERRDAEEWEAKAKAELLERKEAAQHAKAVETDIQHTMHQ